MFENIDTSLIDWSRAQFALTAMYHWLFVPLTLGLAMIMGLMETFYVVTGKEFWKRTAKFWMKLFGINFAVGVATGLILEFEFGTNWSNYSWFVGDIFGAPLAIMADRYRCNTFCMVDSGCQRLDAISGGHGIQS